MSLDSGTRCVDDCVAGMITDCVDGEAASEISYIGIGGSYMLIWKKRILVYTGSLSLTVAISGTAVLGTPASITNVAGAVVAAKTLVYSNPGGGGVVGMIITFLYVFATVLETTLRRKMRHLPSPSLSYSLQ